jgi:hypothetical protein
MEDFLKESVMPRSICMAAMIAGSPKVFTIDSPTRFSRGRESYRHCATERQF